MTTGSGAPSSAFEKRCALVVRWLHGEETDGVIYGDGPDLETAVLTDTLVALNRSGYLTDHSQPGALEDGYAQRAHVSGYCDEPTAMAISARAVTTDLVVLAIPANSDSFGQIPVSREGRVEYTWGGGHSDPANEFYQPGDEELVAELRQLWHVEVIDPVWGRNDLLWDVVVAAVTERPERLVHYAGRLDGEHWPGCRLVDYGYQGDKEES